MKQWRICAVWFMKALDYYITRQQFWVGPTYEVYANLTYIKS